METDGSQYSSCKGQLLVSEPSLADPNFRCTVVLVTEHDEKGAFGLIVNRPGGQTVADLWSGLTGEPCGSEAPVFIGGPVEQAAVFILHNRVDLSDGGEVVIDGLYMGSSLELLQVLIEDEGSAIWADQQVYRVFCGYSGWGGGQLEGELAAGGWVVQSAKAEYIFETKSPELWKNSMDRQGGIYRFFSGMPTDPDVN
ncbi:MAG: YqgE/AlgH family protein [Planctomycetota bacterium]|nr:YqgE/AlgH family protein [Planctomycetota bacterium]